MHVVFLGLPNVPGIASEIFKTLSEHSIGVDMVTQNTMRGGRSDLSFLIQKDKLDEVISLCKDLSAALGGQGVSFTSEVAAIRIPIEKPEDAAKTLAKIFSTLAAANVNIEIINSTPISVMVLVNSAGAESGFKALESVFN